MLKKQFKNPWFYMVYLGGSDTRPVVRHATLNKAMNEAVRLAEKFGHSATVLASLGTVDVVDGKPRWIDVTPK